MKKPLKKPENRSSNGNSARRRAPREREPLTRFQKDLIGIGLIALAIFILVSNLSNATGIVGTYFVKGFIRSLLGVGAYVLPALMALLAVVMLMREEVERIRHRTIGLLLLFGVFVAIAQRLSPTYFGQPANWITGAGGVFGFVIAGLGSRLVGDMGTTIFLGAVVLVGMLLMINNPVETIKAALPFGEKEEGNPKLRRMTPTYSSTIEPDMLRDGESVAPERNNSIAAMIPIIKEGANKLPEMDPSHIEVTPRAPKAKPHKSLAGYQLPPLDLLDAPTAQEVEKREKLREATDIRRRVLEEALQNFGVAAQIVHVSQGPAVTRFEILPEPGVKVSRILNLADDISLHLAAPGVRIEAPIPGKSAVGIEVPNATIFPVRLAEVARVREFAQNPSRLMMSIGKDIGGAPIFGDIARMPHLLVAGTTGSGKSVCINSLILSILMRARPDEVKFLMIDPKMVELIVYNDIPHLLAPVVTDPKKAAITLREWAMKEMERRYHEFAAAGVRNIEGYNSKVAQFEAQEGKPRRFGGFDEAYVPERLPYIVVIIDELADLMMVAAAEVETTICRIAQMARATGIHLVVATQRPSVDIITGLIKANIPSRISFAVATQVDSRVVLDMMGAEKLLGRGDMLYHPIGAMKPIRVQGSFVSDQEVERVTDFIKDQAGPDYVEDIMLLEDTPFKDEAGNGGPGRDSLFGEAAKIIVEGGQASTSHLQRRMRIGYNRAARIMDELEAAGVVSRSEGENKARKILTSREGLKAIGVE